jgi:hypothetical protein
MSLSTAWAPLHYVILSSSHQIPTVASIIHYKLTTYLVFAYSSVNCQVFLTSSWQLLVSPFYAAKRSSKLDALVKVYCCCTCDSVSHISPIPEYLTSLLKLEGTAELVDNDCHPTLHTLISYFVLVGAKLQARRSSVPEGDKMGWPEWERHISFDTRLLMLDSSLSTWFLVSHPDW